MFRRGSARGQDLICGDDNTAAQAVGIEGHGHFGINRARKIALNHQTAEAALAPRLHLWAGLLVPFEQDRAAWAARMRTPVD